MFCIMDLMLLLSIPIVFNFALIYFQSHSMILSVELHFRSLSLVTLLTCHVLMYLLVTS